MDDRKTATRPPSRRRTKALKRQKLSRDLATASDAIHATSSHSRKRVSKLTGTKEPGSSGAKSKKLYLKEHEVAERWGMSVKHIQALRSRGSGPRFTKFGRYVRYHIRELKKYEEANSFHSTSELASKAGFLKPT
jgi:hypothetical protein